MSSNLRVGNTDVLFVGGSKRVIDLQSAFLRQLEESGNLPLGKVTIDNKAVIENSIGVTVFIDLTSGACGFSHVMPSEVVEIFTMFSRERRAKFHWWSAYKGQALPSCGTKKPWEEE